MKNTFLLVVGLIAVVLGTGCAPDQLLGHPRTDTFYQSRHSLEIDVPGYRSSQQSGKSEVTETDGRGRIAYREAHAFSNSDEVQSNPMVGNYPSYPMVTDYRYSQPSYNYGNGGGVSRGGSGVYAGRSSGIYR